MTIRRKMVVIGLAIVAVTGGAVIVKRIREGQKKGGTVVLRQHQERAAIEGVERKMIGHASAELLLQGKSEEDICRLLGKPVKRIQTPPFKELKYHPSMVIPEADTQWIFAKDMEWTVVYFKSGRVVLAIQEWSDF